MNKKGGKSVEKPIIAMNTGGGGNEPQGRQGLAPNESMLEPQATSAPCHPELTFSLAQSGFSVGCGTLPPKRLSIVLERKVPVSWSETLSFPPTRIIQERKSKQKESKTGWLSKQLCHPELDSGSSPRSIIPSSENIKNITSTSHTAQRHVRGDFVPQKESETEWLAEQLCHPELVSGSCPRNIIPSPENIKNIPSASRPAQRHVRGDYVPRKAAFTLAEVLITLGIIGVVAAMTLPSIINNIQKKDTSARLKKFYSAFNQAILLSTVQNGPVSGWPDQQIIYHDSEALYAWFEKYLAPYFSTLKDCQEGGVGCIGDYKIYDPAARTYTNTAQMAKIGIYYIFADGGSIYVYTGGGKTEDGLTNGGVGFEIFYDTNGYNRPNTIGKDIFSFGFPVTQTEEAKNYIKCKGCINGCKDGYVTTRNSRTELLDACKREPATCGCLLMVDGWEFKDDYPW